jgi:hypothetical protein
VGRPEHAAFDQPGLRASHLLDIFGVSSISVDSSKQRIGLIHEVRGHINVNTATKESLRALIVGKIGQDPKMSYLVSKNHQMGIYKKPKTQSVEEMPDGSVLVDAFCEAVLRMKPFHSASELAHIKDVEGRPIFGDAIRFERSANKEPFSLQWSDAAAEELFARVYEATSVRSRNFKIWVVAQAVSGTEARPKIDSEVRRCFQVFADPGVRDADGKLNQNNVKLMVIHESHF